MAAKKPNILIIRGGDIGWFNISAYNHRIREKLCAEPAAHLVRLAGKTGITPLG
jgi:arylsulfatase A-like enzyme